MGVNPTDRKKERDRLLRRTCALFGASACVACLIITVSLLAFKAVMLVEPSPVILALELLVASVGVALNLYYLVRG